MSRRRPETLPAWRAPGAGSRRTRSPSSIGLDDHQAPGHAVRRGSRLRPAPSGRHRDLQLRSDGLRSGTHRQLPVVPVCRPAGSVPALPGLPRPLGHEHHRYRRQDHSRCRRGRGRHRRADRPVPGPVSRRRPGPADDRSGRPAASDRAHRGHRGAHREAARARSRISDRRRLGVLPDRVVARLRAPGAPRSRAASGRRAGRGRRVRQGGGPRLRPVEGSETRRAVVGHLDRPGPAGLAHRVLGHEHGAPGAVVRYPYGRHRLDLSAPRGRDRPERGGDGRAVRRHVAPLRAPPDGRREDGQVDRQHRPGQRPPRGRRLGSRAAARAHRRSLPAGPELLGGVARRIGGSGRATRCAPRGAPRLHTGRARRSDARRRPRRDPRRVRSGARRRPQRLGGPGRAVRRRPRAQPPDRRADLSTTTPNGLGSSCWSWTPSSGLRPTRTRRHSTPTWLRSSTHGRRRAPVATGLHPTGSATSWPNAASSSRTRGTASVGGAQSRRHMPDRKGPRPDRSQEPREPRRPGGRGGFGGPPGPRQGGGGGPWRPRPGGGGPSRRGSGPPDRSEHRGRPGEGDRPWQRRPPEGGSFDGEGGPRGPGGGRGFGFRDDDETGRPARPDWAARRPGGPRPPGGRPPGGRPPGPRQTGPRPPGGRPPGGRPQGGRPPGPRRTDFEGPRRSGFDGPRRTDFDGPGTFEDRESGELLRATIDRPVAPPIGPGAARRPDGRFGKPRDGHSSRAGVRRTVRSASRRVGRSSSTGAHRPIGRRSPKHHERTCSGPTRSSWPDVVPSRRRSLRAGRRSGCSSCRSAARRSNASSSTPRASGSPSSRSRAGR